MVYEGEIWAVGCLKTLRRERGQKLGNSGRRRGGFLGREERFDEVLGELSLIALDMINEIRINFYCM